MWISSKFQLLLVKEYQRLKEEELSKKSLEWNVSRTLAKVNYRIHTDAIKESLIPKALNKNQIHLVFRQKLLTFLKGILFVAFPSFISIKPLTA
jgi:hypothetical protein